MNKISKTILVISIAVFGAGFLFVNSTQAADNKVRFGDKDIFVDFNKLPFDLNNWAPGMSEEKTIKIINNENFDINLYFKAQKTSGDDILADVLTIVVNGESNHLSDLFDNNIFLGSVNSKESQNYDITISFDEGAGNEYQNKIINFDFVITAEEIGKDGKKIPPVRFPGGVFIAAGLTISNERVDDVGITDATIVWDTNKKATSRVIYDTISHPTLGSPPNYGYAFSTIEDPVKVTSHTVVITGLLPGTTYYFRCISHTSPDETITTEHSFTTKGVKGAETEKKEGEEEELPFAEATEGKEGIPEGEVEPIVEGTTTEEGKGEEKEKPIVMPGSEVISGFFPNLLANIGDIFKGFGNWNYIWIAVIAILIYLLVVDFLKRKQV